MNGWNSEEIEAYAKLVDLGKPDFIEIKVRMKMIYLIVKLLEFCWQYLLTNQ